jgi:hypothetical protein
VTDHPCHQLPREKRCNRDGPGDFMGHTCRPTYPSAPRIHGNGFLQVDLDERRRLHVWDHRFPRQRTDSSIHDHAFSFDSRVLAGTLININFRELRGSNGRGHGWGTATHNTYAVARDPQSQETRLRLMPNRRVCLVPRSSVIVHAGDGYHMEEGVFHASFHLGTTVSVITKGRTDYADRLARVAVRVGERPDNDWVRGEQEIPGWAMDLVRRYGDG